MGVESCLIFIPRNLCSTSTESFAKSSTADTSGTGVEAGLGLFATQDWPNDRLVAHYGGVASSRVGGLQFNTCFWSLQMFLRSSPIGVHWWSSQTFLGPCRIKNQLGGVVSFFQSLRSIVFLHCPPTAVTAVRCVEWKNDGAVCFFHQCRQETSIR